MKFSVFGFLTRSCKPCVAPMEMLCSETLTVFPIGRSPSNFVADVWNPKEKPHVKIDGFLDGLLGNLEKVLKIILIILSAILILKIVSIFKRNKRKEKKNEK